MSKALTHRSAFVGIICLFTLTIVSLAGWLVSSVSSASQTPELASIESPAVGDSVRVLFLPTNDIVFNPSDQRIYASVPSSAGSIGNTITPIDPRTGLIEAPVFVGSDPTKLVLASDRNTIYTYLAGSYSIGRFDTATRTTLGDFPVGTSGQTSAHLAVDFAVAPNNPNLIAIARDSFDIAVFENGVQRLNAVTAPGDDAIVFGATDNNLYSSRSSVSLRSMAVDQSGVTQTNVASFSGASIKYDGGKIFASNGQVFDPATFALLGTLPQFFPPFVFATDAAAGRVYQLSKGVGSGAWVLKAYDINTFTLAGSITLTNIPGNATSLIRWGTNGLAFRTDLNQLILVQTSLVPTDDPLPQPSPTPTITPTPTPTPFAASASKVDLLANDLIFSQQREKLYASVPGSGGSARGNTITEIDPSSGAVGASVYVGSEPGRIAISGDEQVLYVGLDGAFAVRQVNLASLTAEQKFEVGSDNGRGPHLVTDLDVAPGSSETVAISRDDGGIAIYDHGIQRPQWISTISPSGDVEFGDADTLYAYNPGPFLRLKLVADGLAQDASIPAGITYNFVARNGLIYCSNGRVINATTGRIAGTFAGIQDFNPVFAVDTSANRVYFAATVFSNRLYAFELDTFRLVGSVQMPNLFGTPKKIVRWGTNGMAIRTTNNQVYLLRSSLIDPGEPVPTPTPTVSPTPTPTPTPVYVPAFVRKVSVPTNDLTYNSQLDSIIATVPSSAGTGLGNTISYIDPDTAEITSSVFIGSEPGRIAASDDGRTIYAVLDGANAIRRYDVASKTPGLQFAIPSGFLSLSDIKVMPGYPGTIALAHSAGSTEVNRVGIFDDGVLRPGIGNGGVFGVFSIGFTEVANVFYGVGFDYNLRDGLVKFTADNTGVTGTFVANRLLASGAIQYLDGVIYCTSGRVANPTTKTVLGTFQGGGQAMAIDKQNNRAFFMNGNVLSAFDLSSFVKIGSITLPTFDGNPASLTRWGENGLAFRVTNSFAPQNNQIYLVQTALVSDAVPVSSALQLTSATYSASEAGPNVNVTVTRNGGISGTASVDYATSDGTAKAGSDYVASAGTITFAAGETNKTLAIPLVNDNVFEPTESFGLLLTNATGAQVNLMTPNSATISIADNDARPRISANGLTVDEPRRGNSAVVNVTVQLSNPSVETVTVNYATANGTATSASDYVATTGTLVFNPLETVKTVPITILGDNLEEPEETVLFNLSGPTNSSIQIAQAIIRIRNTSSKTFAFDFDGDGKADLAVRRAADNVWYFLRTTAGYTGLQYGEAGDMMAPADYDGDGKTDVAVFRPSIGTWFIAGSSVGFYSDNWGASGDLPVPADYDGDGKADIAVYRPSNGTWYRKLSSGALSIVQFGTAEDKPQLGDFDGDGKADLAVARPSDNTWYFLRTTAGFTAISWGAAGDINAPADYDGDGKTDPAVFRPSTGEWFIAGSSAGFSTRNWGANGDIPVVADYDGDGKADPAVFRPSNNAWYLMTSASGIAQYQFGAAGDVPVPSVFGH